MMAIASIIIRWFIQYEDTDAGGITYHASYINFARTCALGMVEAVGFSLSDWLSERNQGFIILTGSRI